MDIFSPQFCGGRDASCLIKLPSQFETNTSGKYIQYLAVAIKIVPFKFFLHECNKNRAIFFVVVAILIEKLKFEQLNSHHSHRNIGREVFPRPRCSLGGVEPFIPVICKLKNVYQK